MICLSDTQMSALMDDVSGYVTGCPEPAIRSAISMAVDDYIRDVGGILFRDAIRPMGDKMSFYVDAPYGGSVNGIRSLAYNGYMLNRADYVVCNGEDGTTEIRILRRTLGPISGARNDYLVVGTWMPTHRTMQLPQTWFEENYDGIRNGSLYNLFSQIKHPWGDQALMQKFDSDYRINVNYALRRLHEADNRGGQISVFDPTNDWTCGGFL